MRAVSDVKSTLAAILVDGHRGAPAADRLCAACVPLIGIDEAAMSLIDAGESRGTFGASSAGARRLDGLQFSAGEGPCLDAVATMSSVLVDDLQMVGETRWPAFREAADRSGVRAVFAIPVCVGRISLGALDLFRYQPGPISPSQLVAAMAVADAAAQVLLDVVEGTTEAERAGPVEQWEQVASLARIEVYQATGMIMAQLNIGAIDALVRLRAYAFAHEMTAAEVASAIVSRKLQMEP
jgi:hypothetical protein